MAALGAPERAFLLGALLHRDLPRDRLRALAEGGLDWRTLEAAAGATGVLPLVANALDAAAGGAGAPREVAERLRAALEQNAARNALVARDLAAMDAVLRAEGVEAVALKGAALVALDPAYAPLRAMSDVDLLVPPGAARDAAEALRRSGLARPPDRALHLDGSHHPEILVSRSGVPIELHERLGPRAEGGAALAALLRERSARPGGVGMRLPCPEDLLGLAAWHALVHHRHDLAHRPRLVADVHELLALGADARAAAARHDGPGARPVADALALVESARAAAARPSRFGTLPAERPLSAALRAAGRIRGTWSADASRLIRSPGALFFPSRRFMAARYGVPERSSLLPLLYLYRPFRGLFRLLTGR